MAVTALEELLQATRSDQQLVRSCALQELLAWVKKDPLSHPAVLPVFRNTLEVERDPEGVVSAVLGIEEIVGGEEARNAWLTVLAHPDAAIVFRAAYSVTNPSFGPVLLELLARRPEIAVRSAAISALGRLQCAEAFPVIVAKLAAEETRWASIEALSNLGDARAIPYLEPFLNDQSALRGRDDRGCEIDVPHIAGCAIRRLQFLAARGTQTPDSVRPAHHFAAYLPLIAALVEIPWIIVVSTLTFEPLNAGTRAGNAARIHQMDLLAAIPVAAGLLIGIARGRTALRLADRICLYLGCAVCAVFLYVLGSEFFN